jgi:WD40 repeat protein
MKPFPGKPQSQLQAVCTALWDGRRIVAYIAGDALVILGGANDLIQTIQVDAAGGEGGGGDGHGGGGHAKLSAIAMHDVTGKIAAATGNCICIYKPFGQDFGAPKWALEHTFHTESNEDDIYSLSWGLAEELLVGGTTLSLFSTHQAGGQLWSRDVANPIKSSALSPDGSFIATTGRHDRLVKIWRRLYFSEENERFDVSYLPHSAAVTELHWHGRRDPEYHAEAILYTTSADHKLRVWAATETHGLQALQLWAELDLTQCMAPEIQPKPQGKRYAFVIDNWEYEALVERVTHRSSNTEKDQEMLKRLVDVAYRDPDICIVLDDQGNMSAWGLERIGCKARQENNVFKIAQVSGVDVHAIEDVEAFEDYATCLSFAGQGDGCEVNLLIHFFDGRLQWLSCPVDRLFYADASSKSFTTEAVFTGHTEVIKSLKPAYNGAAVISRSADKEIVLWRHPESLQRAGSIPAEEAVRIALPLLDGTHAVTVDDREITLWDARKSKATKLSSQRLPAEFYVTDCAVVGGDTPKYVLITTNNLGGTLYSITNSADGQPEFLEQVCIVSVVDNDRSAIFILVPGPVNTQSLSAVSVTATGTLVSWTLNIQPDQESCAWESTDSLDTGIKDITAVAANSNLKAVLLDPSRTTLTIWNIPNGSLEYTERYSDHDSVEHIEWTSTPDGIAVLAVAFSHKVVLYAQLPYELSVAGVADPWTRLREINISELTNLPISQCAWLAGGNLLLAAGNQMFAFENKIDGRTAHELGLPTRSKTGHEVYNVVSAMNSTLPAFHPQFLRQLILAGIFELVHMIVATLNNTLKFHAPGDKLDSFLKLDIMSLVRRQSTVGENVKQSYAHDGDDDDAPVVTEDLATALKDRLTDFHLPHIPASQRDELIRLTDSIGANQKQQQSVDHNGFQYLTLSREHFTQPQAEGQTFRQLSSREMVLAYRSTSQEVLLDATSQHYKGRILWKDAKECGMFLWMTDLPALV